MEQIGVTEKDVKALTKAVSSQAITASEVEDNFRKFTRLVGPEYFKTLLMITGGWKQ